VLKFSVLILWHFRSLANIPPVMDYHLKPIGKTCAATGDKLRPGTKCYSVLVEQDGEMLRLDYAEEAWSGPPAGTVGQWKCEVPEPETEKVKPLDPDALMRYFEQLNEDSNPAQEKFRYVLALLLMQKKRLKLDDSRHDGEIEYLVFVGMQGEGTFEVRDQNLSDDEITQLQASLDTHLDQEWS